MTKIETGPTQGFEGDGHSERNSASLAAIGRRLTHQIRNPLSIIMAAAGQLRESSAIPGESDEKAYVEAISSAVDRIAETLDRFSQYACPEPPRMQAVDLNDLCRRQISERASGSQPGSKKAIDFLGDENLPETVCDPYQIGAALAHLIDNALQAPGSGRRVTLRTGASEKAVIITLENDGDSIPEKYLNKVFQPFFSSRPGRSGLGMAIAGRIVGAHHGNIAIESPAGGGTRVVVTLPQTGFSEE